MGDMCEVISMVVKTESIVHGGLWKLFPVINVDKTKDIPCDYPGAMGVPITFMDKYNAEQFEVIGITNHVKLEDGREPYRRVVIRHLHPDLPDEVDLVEWMRRCGKVTVMGEDGIVKAREEGFDGEAETEVL